VEDSARALQQDSVGAQDDQAIGEACMCFPWNVLAEGFAKQRREAEQLTVTIAEQKKTYRTVTETAVPVIENQLRWH
jgi:hypothetical protein